MWKRRKKTKHLAPPKNSTNQKNQSTKQKNSHTKKNQTNQPSNQPTPNRQTLVVFPNQSYSSQVGTEKEEFQSIRLKSTNLDLFGLTTNG